MPTLLEVQRAVGRSLIERDDAAAAEHVVGDGLAPAARLNVYRNTFVGTLTKALHLSFPAVHRLVGAEFFESVARLFIEAAPPRSAYLDEYGADFPAFLESFQPAAGVVYLPGVARLEWAVSRALHAPDAAPLDPARLAAADPTDHSRVCLVPHPSVELIESDYPVDMIWRAVLAQDDAAMAAIDLGAGPVHLIVQRRKVEIDVTRLDDAAWRFTASLCASGNLQAAIDEASGVDATALLASHLVNGMFTDFTVAPAFDPSLRENPV